MKKLTRKDFLKVSGMGLGAVSLAMLTGCGSSSESSSSSSASESEGTTSKTKVTIGVTQTCSSIAPFNPSWGNADLAMKSVAYETLGAYDENKEVVPFCAKSWTETAEQTYTIELYDYIVDRDGNNITIDDIIAFWDYAYEANYTSITRYLESYEKLSDYAVSVVLADNFVDSLDGLLVGTRVFSWKAYEESNGFENGPISTTAYECVSYTSGSGASWKKVDSYWQTDASLIPSVAEAIVEEIEFVPIVEAAQQSVALETGTIDVMLQMSTSVISRFQDNSAYGEVSFLNPIGYQLYFSGSEGKPTADNLKLRQAIAYAINNEAIVMTALEGNGQVKKDFGSSIHVGYNEKWDDEDYYDYDPDKAAELLAEAGYAPDELELTILTLSSDSWSKCAQVIQSNLRDIGITVTIDAFDSALYGSSFADGKNYDLMINCVGGTYNAAIVKSKLHSSVFNGSATASWYDPELDSLIEAACTVGATEADQDALHYYMIDTLYAYGLYDNVTFTFYNAETVESCPFDALATLMSGAIILK
ncbi:MAG: ABC transporter substrate-binding protein [Lachnospiraceae bacterium]|nr:ABC transporter substrate-binding protein [Lachnospiraceae bacterium]